MALDGSVRQPLALVVRVVESPTSRCVTGVATALGHTHRHSSFFGEQLAVFLAEFALTLVVELVVLLHQRLGQRLEGLGLESIAVRLLLVVVLDELPERGNRFPSICLAQLVVALDGADLGRSAATQVPQRLQGQSMTRCVGQLASSVLVRSAPPWIGSVTKAVVL